MDVQVISKKENWCTQDKHQDYENYSDFNEWLDDFDSVEIREKYNINGLTQPSKALYAGDLEAYIQAFKQYRIERRNEILKYNIDGISDGHWYDRNCTRFDQLVDCMEREEVVPFIGAGISTNGGFPTWKEHLRQQSRTARINVAQVEKLISNGQFEDVIDEIEKKRGKEVFIQEIRDVFSKTGSITEITLLITELFTDTVITTNYDRLLEQAYDTGKPNAFQVINSTNAMDMPLTDRVTIHKLHGTISSPGTCILSKNQYNQAYGSDFIDLTLAIPKLLIYFYINSSFLFLGCSLNDDRTIKVFQEFRKKNSDELPQHFSIEEAPGTEEELANRNEYLLKLGITPIWYDASCYEKVESMLRLAKNELNYRGTYPRKKRYGDS